MSEHYDLIVIGSGPAGSSGAMHAAQLGKRVALVERDEHLGGTGLSTGTVPSKTLRETAYFIEAMQRRNIAGLQFVRPAELYLGDILYSQQRVLESEWGLIRGNVERSRISVLRGQAVFTATTPDGFEVTVTHGDRAQHLTASYALVASGSLPRYPTGMDLNLPNIYDSWTVRQMGRVPRSMLILGGGVIGTEYACIFNALGVQVTVLELGDRLLPTVDRDLSERVRQHLERNEVRVILNHNATSAEATEAGLRFILTNGETLAVEAALVAAGRVGNVQALNLPALGVALDANHFIQADANGQSSAPRLYAAGDVTGHQAYVATSITQATRAVSHAFGQPLPAPPIIPRAIFTVPEIATVGLSEAECQAQGLSYLVGRASYQSNPRGQLINDTVGFVKLVFATADGRLLGAHHVGESAAELIHIPLMTLLYAGTIHDLGQAAFNYPTLADVYKSAAQDGEQRLKFWRSTRPK